MAISAVFPAGVVAVTLKPSYQWDRGQTLEIHVNKLTPRVEVHYSYPGLDEAIACTCTVADGVATAPIPDRCFEQSQPITAWVYVISTAQGKTIKKITIPIIKRTMPPRTVLEVSV